MNIVGWIRKGDRAACGGVVLQGSECDVSHGRAYAYQGAQMACRHACKIAQGFPHATLSNQRNMVHHGQRTMRGCALLSTLNNIDGLSAKWLGLKNPQPDSRVFKPVSEEATLKKLLASPTAKNTKAPPPSPTGQCYHEVFQVTDLPLIMQRHGWEVGAALMNEWFSRKGFFRTPEKIKEQITFRGYDTQNINTNIVTMDWLLSFDRFKNKLDELLAYENSEITSPPLFATRNSKLALMGCLKRNGVLSSISSEYNSGHPSALFLEKNWQHQRMLISSVGSKSLLNKLGSDCNYDDADAALGDFSVHLASSGQIKSLPKQALKTWQISIRALHIYLKDSYDFDGRQYLGNWSLYASPGLNTHWKKGMLGSLPGLRKCPHDYVPVFNRHFREHRKATGLGGDFMILSDVKTILLKKEYVFTFNANDLTEALEKEKL